MTVARFSRGHEQKKALPEMIPARPCPAKQPWRGRFLFRISGINQ
jgi:hypothetical protein